MNENDFKPFDKVLVRNMRGDKWRCDWFSHAIRENVCGDYYACTGGNFCQCIPYDGNEALLGTTDSPQPKRWRAEKDGVYYYVNSCMEATDDTDNYTETDDARYDASNYFQTGEEAQAMADCLGALLKGE